MPAPWLRAVDEGADVTRRNERHIKPVEAVLAIIVIAGVVAFAVWFLFIATGGPGPGTV